MAEIMLLGIKCAKDRALLVMHFMDCLEYRLLDELPCALPGKIEFSAGEDEYILWYHGKSPHIRPDRHLLLSGRSVVDDRHTTAGTSCGRSSLCDMLNDLAGKTDIYYLYRTSDSEDSEWKESVFENGITHHFFTHNHTDGDKEYSDEHIPANIYHKLYDVIRRNAEAKGYSDIIVLISREFNKNINDIYYEDEFDQYHYEGEGIYIPADFKNIYEKSLDGYMFYSLELKRIKVSPDNQFYCDLDGVLFSKDRKKLIRMPVCRKGRYIIPEGTEVIGRYAFSGSRLSEVIIPATVKKTEEEAFESSCITSVMIPEGFTRIEEKAFLGCERLEKVILPDSLEVIGEHAFDGCEKLTEVHIPAGVKLFDNGAFYECSALADINIPPDAEVRGLSLSKTAWSEKYKGDFVIVNGKLYEYKGSDENVIIPEGVTSIGFWAFGQNEKLFSVTIPDTCTEIESSAFYECNNLTVVHIPASVKSIGHDSFMRTKWADSSEDFIISNGILLKYKGKDKNVTVPEGVHTIGESAFYCCYDAESVKLPESLRRIESMAFYHCNHLADINIPAGVEYISRAAFEHCDELFRLIKAGKRENIVVIPFTEEELMNIAGTDRHTGAALENTGDLSDEEYLRLYSYCLNLSGWYDYSHSYTGSNYLMLLHERDPERFRRCFRDAVVKTYTSINNEDFYSAFDKLCPLFAVTDKEVYRQLLELGIKSPDGYIADDAKGYLSGAANPDEEAMKQLLRDNADFRRRLGIS